VIDKLTRLWCGALLRAPVAVLMAILAVAAVGTVLGTRLTINTNQLDQLDPDIRAVRDTERVIDMSGGAGMLTLALRGQDPELLKRVGDDVAERLGKDPERIRTATAKLPIDFFKAHAAMYLAPEDLAEVKRRTMLWLKDAQKRASPFFFEIKKTEPVKLDISDIQKKYERIGGKSLASEYFLSADGQLLLVRIKPHWDSNELGKTEALVEDLRATLTAYHEGGVTLVEDYEPTPAADPKTVEFGFTGTYQSNYEDSYSMKSSLVPVSGIAFLGVLLTLGAFFRRHLFMVVMVVSALLLGVAMTFGFARISIGELNVVTTILGGILLGFGIDFGIHFAYRMRYELRLGLNLEQAVVHTVAHSGPASLASAVGVGAAFASLLFSDFRGFSDFGLLAGVGVMLVGAVTYLWVPAFLIAIDRRWPGLPARLMDAGDDRDDNFPVDAGRIARPGLKLGVAAVIALALVAFAPGVGFEYNSRALMVEGQPSVALQDEVRHRFGDFGDPVAVFTPDLEQARQLHDIFTPLDPARFPTVERAVTPFTFVPPKAQQEANLALLAEWRAELEGIDRKALPPEYEARWDEAQGYLNATEVTFEDLPPVFKQLVTNLPTAKPENHGYLSYLYPAVDLWDGKKMLAFADDVENIQGPNGVVFHASGLPILFATLARIVLADGKNTVLLTALFLLVILMVDLRSLQQTLAALLPLGVGMGVMLGVMALFGVQLNFMNVVVFPIILGYGISHGVYLLHRFREGVSPKEALRSVGVAVACSTVTSMVGWAALMFAAHKGLHSMGVVACLGMLGTLLVSFTVMMPLLQIAHDRRTAAAPAGDAPKGAEVHDA
jgi:predicted RND superfamily exporter protein